MKICYYKRCIVPCIMIVAHCWTISIKPLHWKLKSEITKQEIPQLYFSLIWSWVVRAEASAVSHLLHLIWEKTLHSQSSVSTPWPPVGTQEATASTGSFRYGRVAALLWTPPKWLNSSPHAKGEHIHRLEKANFPISIIIISRTLI